jgi:cytochrome c556
MKRYVVRTALAMAIGGVSLAFGDQLAPTDGPGWTGVTNPKDVIAAREGLMVEIERIMRPIDSFTIGEPADPDDLRSTAATVSQMLLAVPHLFPPTTNVYDPDAETPETIALPAIWKDFSTFYALAAASSAAATQLASMTDVESLKAGGKALRASCDACHTLFLRPYVPEPVNSDDLNFDFDSVLPKD